jgi:hypothetical protein
MREHSHDSTPLKSRAPLLGGGSVRFWRAARNDSKKTREQQETENKNDLGQYIPQAVPMGVNTPGGVPKDGDYYEIAIVDYPEQVHADMPATKMRGYVQIEPPGGSHTSR